ncbi:MAG: hypothetical protein FJZ59_05545 [Chlamydiae bacterium]|nr:hypothetical protein [Chlamydiota bacterium]
MVETLEGVKTNPLYDRVILIAGYAHLIEIREGVLSEDPRLELTSLHKFLLTVPSIIVRMKESV